MIDHLVISVRDFKKSRAFYAAALAPTGHSKLVDMYGSDPVQPTSTGFCHADGSDLWIRAGEATSPPLHLAFRVPLRSDVEAFHAAALAAGGRDNGPPGLRPHYHPDYYAAFVLDPDGHNIEAVCHATV